MKPGDLLTWWLVRGDNRTYGLILCGSRLGWRRDDLLERVTGDRR